MHISKKEQIIQAINELSDIAEQLGDSLSRIETDLLRQKCVALYDLILASDAVAKPVVPVTPPEEPLVAEATVLLPAEEPAAEMIPEEIVEELPEIIEEEEETEEPVFVPEPFLTLDEKPQEPPAVKPEVVEMPAAEMNGELVQEAKENPVLEEFLHQKLSKTIPHADVVHRFDKHVESLKSAITLNKKIAFVNDLFRENTVEYAKAIERLNTAEDLNAALRFFNELKYAYGWDTSNELVKDLEDLVVKKYS